MCGKNVRLMSWVSNKLGSPPRVREKLHVLGERLSCIRITPACAGKTLYSVTSNSLARDHPRVCGKNHNLARLCLFFVGSPPRVREKPELIGRPISLSGDHPRVCGKNFEKIKRRLGIDGITPACAGKTFERLAE